MQFTGTPSISFSGRAGFQASDHIPPPLPYIQSFISLLTQGTHTYVSWALNLHPGLRDERARCEKPSLALIAYSLGDFRGRHEAWIWRIGIKVGPRFEAMPCTAQVQYRQQ